MVVDYGGLSLPVIEGIEDCGVLALHVGADAYARTRPYSGWRR